MSNKSHDGGRGGGKLDFEGLASRLLAGARALVEEWLPGGKYRGHEYLIGNLSGEPGESLSINVNTGKWSDFASGEKGGDLISLYAAVKRIGQGAAAKELGALPLDPKPARPPRMTEAERPIGRPPEDAKQPSFKFVDKDGLDYGKPTGTWAYKDVDGSLIGYIARYDPAGLKKQLIPWTWDKAKRRWRNWSFTKPRPLYGLELLAARPEARVLVVEGEKAADAARELLPAYVVVTWPGGCEALDHADLAPLLGRKVDLWPDADSSHVYPKGHAREKQVRDYRDQPGPAAMLKIAGRLHGKCPELRVVHVADAGVDGWDLADAKAAGWDTKRTIEWARQRIKPYEPAPVVDLKKERAKRQPDAEERDVPVSAYGVWEQLGLECTDRGPVANLSNVLRVLENHPELNKPAPLVRYDEFHGKYFHRDGHEWADVDELQLATWMQRACRFRKASSILVHQAAIVYAQRHKTNEPRDWMEALAWDGTPRIGTFFGDALGAKGTGYIAAASRNFWIGMVARVYQPGCRLRQVIVLEGKQNKGKSFALAKIGGPWYAEASESVTSKDFFISIQGKLLIEIAELDAFRRAELTRIKQVISAPIDRFRAPYARTAQDFPRRCVFVASTNEDVYLGDVTGGTRFLPVPTGEINLDYIEQARAQCFAEAVAAFKSGETWWIIPEAAARNAQESRRQADEWEAIIANWLRELGPMIEEITMREVAKEALEIKVDKLDRLTQRRIADCLRALGWQRGFSFYDKTARVWKRAGVEE